MLFDNDNYFGIDNNLDLNMIFNMLTPSTRPSNTSVELYNVEEGFLRGNMFKGLYDEYKNYKPIKPKFDNERERLMYEVSMYDFAINDLNLYLDLYPKDENMFNIFREYISNYEKKKKEYEEKYGPLCITDTTKTYNWLDNPWPWDGGKNV